MSMGINKGIDRSMSKYRKKSMGIFMRWILLCLAIVFILLGMYRGETQDVLRKAVNICMECIGIG